MKKILLNLTLVVAFLMATFTSKAQIVEINGLSTSPNSLFGSSNYAANENIYTESEIGAGNFITATNAIDTIGFNVYTVGANATYNNVSIYMKDVPLSTTFFTTSANYSTAGYTLVFSGSVAMTTTGFNEIALTNPYVRTPGTNLQVLITRTDGITHGCNFYCANGNSTNSALNTTRRYNATQALSGSTVLALTPFRPAIRLKHFLLADLGVTEVYTLGKLPLPNASSQVISASIKNSGIFTETNIDVLLDIAGANFYSALQTIPSLAPGASATVTFPATTFTNTGINNVTITLPADANTFNDVKTITQNVNSNTWSYAYGPTPSGGVGFNPGVVGDFVARFNTNAATLLTQVSINFSASGGRFKIGVWDATGPGGTPGANLWLSDSLNATSGLYVLPVVPAISIPAGDFFVGVHQLVTSPNVSFAYQAESPIRASTFYYISGTATSWIDFAPASPFRFMIEPKLILATDASVSSLILNNGLGSSCPGSFQDVDVVISNTGANTIMAGSAAVTLKVAGANTYTNTTFNGTNIGAGASETITFSGVPTGNPGTNFDTAWVVLTGDGEDANDTFKTSQTIFPTIISSPATEGFDNTNLIVSHLTQLTGAGNWALQNGPLGTPYFTTPLAAHSSSRFALFNAYNFANGTASRLYSDCIVVPPIGVSSCNNPALGFWMSHDNTWPSVTPPLYLDSMYVSISTNGGATWTRLNGYQRYDASFTTPGWKKEIIDLSAYAGMTIEIAFDAYGKFGNIIGLDDITIGSLANCNVNLATSASNSINLTQACDDAGWTYYVDPVFPNDFLIALQWDPANAGANVAAKATAIPQIQVDGASFSVQNGAAQNATFTSRRYWNVDLGSSALTGPVNLRFFYDSLEINQITTAVNNFITANGGTAEPPTWFKTVSGPFANTTAYMDEIGVFNALYLTNSNTTNERVNGFPYAQFDGLTNFSGGTYAAGVGTSTPLPVQLIAIDATNAGTRNRINWIVSALSKADYFMVEKSNDGVHFEDLGKVDAQSSSSTANITYTAYDLAPQIGMNYYRIRIMDQGGYSTYSKIVSVKNNADNAVSIYPNPVKDVMNIDIRSDKDQEAEMLISDLSGRIIVKFNRQLTKGLNHISTPVDGLAKGSYLLKITTGDKNTVQKFNVQ